MIKKSIQYIKKEIGWIPFVFAFLMTAKTLGLSIGPIDLIAYTLLILTAIYMLSKGIKTDGLCMALAIYIPISLALAQPNPVFRSWMRYVLFFLLFVVTSPMLQSDFVKLFRQKVFKGVSLLCVVISAVSFVCYFLGINMMRNQFSGVAIDDYVVNNAGTFSGITSQSMLLGPISGVAVLVCAYYAIVKNHKRIWVLAAMCTGSLLFAASRSSLFATIVGVLFLFCFFLKRRNVIVKRAIPVLLAAAITYPVWNSALEGVNNKNTSDISQGINTDSRSKKWSIRLEEFGSSPIYGIGFVSVSEKDDYDPIRGIIEPGSSWLAVLSMTGIIGFFLFCRIFYRAGKNAIKYRTPEGALLGAILILVGVHMIAEGHIFSGGSFLCFLVWITIGVATDYKPNQIAKAV